MAGEDLSAFREIVKHGSDMDILNAIFAFDNEDLDILREDSDWRVRAAVAERKRNEDLDILRNDPESLVRAAVARCSRRNEDMDILRYDLYANVRAEVAKQGRDEDLDILVNDPALLVREAVVEYGRPKDLEILREDSDWRVRAAVAKYGRNEDLNVLVNDPNKYVREEVMEHVRPQDLDILRNDPDEEVREAVARKGREEDLEVLRNDPEWVVRYAVQKREDLVRYAVQKREDLDLASMANEATKQQEVSNPEPEASNHDKDERLMEILDKHSVRDIPKEFMIQVGEGEAFLGGEFRMWRPFEDDPRMSGTFYEGIAFEIDDGNNSYTTKMTYSELTEKYENYLDTLEKSISVDSYAKDAGKQVEQVNEGHEVSENSGKDER